jgi:hypothetical protein
METLLWALVLGFAGYELLKPAAPPLIPNPSPGPGNTYTGQNAAAIVTDSNGNYVLNVLGLPQLLPGYMWFTPVGGNPTIISTATRQSPQGGHKAVHGHKRFVRGF